MKFLMKILHNKSGTTAIEYSLIAAGVALVIISSVKLVGSSISGTMTSVVSQL